MTTDKAPELTDAERAALERNPQDAARYARIRDLPTTTGGGRSVADILAAIEVPDDKE
jgi:hypothetical protein